MQARSQHIVHGVLSLDLGGLERLVLELTRRGRHRNQRISVVCIEREGVLAKQARELGATVFCLAKPPGRSLPTLQAAIRLLASLNPDIIHSHQIGALWYLGQAARRIGTKCVVHTEHADHVTQAPTASGKIRARYLWWQAGRFAQRFCCVSPDIAESVGRWGTVSRQKIAVVPNGIDIDKFTNCTRSRGEFREQLGIPHQSLVVGTVGRLAQVKQHSLLLRVLPQLRQALGDVRLLVIGDGPERTNLEQLTVQLGIERFVIFAGCHPEPFSLGAAMDVFAMTSRHEGLPLSLLEAWAVGLPTVCSAVGGMTKVVEHGVNGLLFPEGNCEALVNALCHLLKCDFAARQIAAAGRSTVIEHYSSDRMMREYARQYELASA